jgi:hypothetical protein
MSNQNSQNQECCPEFNPLLWNDIILEWDNKKFIKDKVCTLFYMPLNFGKAMTRLDEKLRNTKTICPEYLCLSEHTSMWNMNLYLAVDKEVPGAQNIILSGKYYCKVYEGNFNETGKWTKDFNNTAKEKGYNIDKLYMWYTTCPKCAKKYGKNYVVIIGRI